MLGFRCPWCLVLGNYLSLLTKLMPWNYQSESHHWLGYLNISHWSLLIDSTYLIPFSQNIAFSSGYICVFAYRIRQLFKDYSLFSGIRSLDTD